MCEVKYTYPGIIKIVICAPNDLWAAKIVITEFLHLSSSDFSSQGVPKAKIFLNYPLSSVIPLNNFVES